MISDSFVVGDNVYLHELKNFFFEVLGIMSITHYGCIGDCRTDNYAPLQVAIDDANRRGLCYLYVPYGRYRYRGNLINRENITFIGNSKAKIFNDRTGEEIEIIQFGLPGCCGKCKMTFLEQNLVLVDGTVPDLDTGSYFTDAYFVTINGNVVLPRGVPFYYDGSTRTLSWLTGYAKYENGVWVIYEGPEPIEEDDEMKAIMTAKLLGEPIHPETGLNELTLTNSIVGGTMPDLLTLENGRIVIGENVTQVKVSAMFTFTPSFYTIVPANHEMRKFGIYRSRNGAELQLALGAVRFYRNEMAGMVTMAISPELVEVMEGDEIYIAYDDFETTDYLEQKTYLTVEVVGYSGGNTPHPSFSNRDDLNPAEHSEL